jgi:hypothetical protein
LAKAKILDRWKSWPLHSRDDNHQVLTLSERSSARQRHAPVLAMTMTREQTRSDLESLNCSGRRNQGSSETVGKPVTMIEAELVLPRDQASSQGFRNLKIESQGEIIGVFDRADFMGKKGHHISNIGQNHGVIRPVKRYTPTLGLISLFHKTGNNRRNPTHHMRTPVQLMQLPQPNRSYVDMLCSGMESNCSMQGNNFYHNGFRGYRDSQGDAFTRGGFQMLYQRYGGSGFHANQGGGGFLQGCGYVPRGRGYNALIGRLMSGGSWAHLSQSLTRKEAWATCRVPSTK